MPLPPMLVLTKYLQMLVEQLIDRGETASAIAKRAGVSHSQISLVRAGDRGVGPKTLVGLSEVLGKDLGELQKEAKAWAAANPDQIPLEPERDRYPTRAATIEWAEKCGYPEAAIERLRALKFQGPDPGGDHWLNLLKVFAAQPDMPLGEPVAAPEPPPSSARLPRPTRR